MPGRRTPPTPERSRTWPSRAFTSVPRDVPAPGCTTSPAGLFTTIRWPSSCTTASSMSSGCGTAGTGAGTMTRAAWPGRRRAEAPCAGPVEHDAALVDQGLEPRAGEGRQALREPNVEPLARGVQADDELVLFPHARSPDCGFLVARHHRSSSE